MRALQSAWGLSLRLRSRPHIRPLSIAPRALSASVCPHPAAHHPHHAVHNQHPAVHNPLSAFMAFRPLPFALTRPRLVTQHSSTIPCFRTFHTTPPRHDVFFLSVPAIKGALLNVTRFSLLVLPFVFRYRLWKKYRRTSMLLIQLPIFAFCIVLALGLDQSPRTGRWRLLLMGEHEEIAWSYRKRKDVLLHDGPLILPHDDPRSQQVGRVVTRLVTALEEQDGYTIHGATWPPRQDLAHVMIEREEAERLERYEPSCTAKSTWMPWRPESHNPLKACRMGSGDWNVYVIDLPQVNAFALPSKDIFIYTGLLNTLPPDDTMLAAVLAHEVAHVVQRHSVENLGFLNLAAVAFDVLRGISFAFTISFPVVTDSAAMFINWLNDVVAERAFSRKLEEEADAVGLDLMAMAGYDPRGMLDLWELMSCVEADAEAAGQTNGFDKVDLLRTHPTSEARREATLRCLPKAMKIWTSAREPQRASIERLLLSKAESKPSATEANSHEGPNASGTAASDTAASTPPVLPA